MVAGKTLVEVEVLVRELIKAEEKKEIAITVRPLSRPGEVVYVLVLC